MKRLIDKARKIHRNQKGFTLIELLVVMAILAILVGLIVPNFFEIPDNADAIMIQGQHEKMREAVLLYYLDTGEWPTEWSGVALGTTAKHQLWHADNVSGWDGPYIDRPILQKNKWGGNWGVYENVTLWGMDGLYTVLFYDNVPRIVCEQVDQAMDDGDPASGWYTGAVQFRAGANFPGVGNPPTPEGNRLTIIIARQ
ncbi:type II secretion system GspH family protein [Dehalococcoidia bacterium]|nr:type II secretion system GspH family protein [Dehalococcoidia bacterium]